jgi:hypothetical protein
VSHKLKENVEKSTNLFHQLIEPAVGRLLEPAGQPIEPAEQLIRSPAPLPVGQRMVPFTQPTGTTGLMQPVGQLMQPVGELMQPDRQLMQLDRQLKQSHQQLMQPLSFAIDQPRAFSPHSIDFILKKDKI